MSAQSIKLSTVGNTLSFGSQGDNSVSSNRVSVLIDDSTRGYSSHAPEIIAIIPYIHIPPWSMWRIFLIRYLLGHCQWSRPSTGGQKGRAHQVVRPTKVASSNRKRLGIWGRAPACDEAARCPSTQGQVRTLEERIRMTMLAHTKDMK